MRKFRKLKWINLFLLPTIISLGVFFRIYKFNSIPFGLNHDAALNGLVAIDLWHRLPEYIPYNPGWIGESLYHYWLGFNFFLFGINARTLRFASILIGIATLPVFFVIAREVQNKRAALFSLFFLAVSGWHVIMSKVGWSVILVPFFQSIVFVFLYKALKENKSKYWIASGVSLALTLNTYGAARVTPLIFLVLITYWYFTHRRYPYLFRNLLFFLISFLLVIQPLLKFALHDWQTFTGRAQFLAVTNRVRETSSFEPLIDNLKVSVGILHLRANGDDFFVNEPLLERIPGYIFLIGFVSLLLNLSQFKFFLILCWFILGFFPGIFSVPSGNHNISMLVPLYLIIGQGMETIFIILKKYKWKFLPIANLAFALLFILTLADSYQQYLSKNRREIWGFYPETTVVADFINQNTDEYSFYLTDNYPRDALTFITYSEGNPFKKHYTWLENKENFLEVKRQKGKGLMFFMFDISQNHYIKKQLLENYASSFQYNLMYIDDKIKRITSSIVIVPP